MADKKINIKDINKADVLAVLYNASKPQGMGFMQYDPKPMKREEAQKMIDAGYTYFDYLKGRVMKIDISGDELNPGLYDRDNGQGAAEKAISVLYKTKQTNPQEVIDMHVSGTQKSASELEGHLHDKSEYEGNGVFCLGYDDVAYALEPKVKAAVKKIEAIKNLDDLKK
ncbi:MAG: hypothetical protein NTV63_02925 [Candidatus Woesearchaeota archaeon]|nr:hypothetical protein [Candidatus Woesearchaeota archaeon]